jgi:hypothetical protein
VPIVPAGRLDVVIVNPVGLIVMVRLAVAVSGVLSESLTPMVKLDLAAVVGVPEITPVVAATESPAGKLPELTLHE